MSPTTPASPDPRFRTHQRLTGSADPATVAQWRRIAQDWLQAKVAMTGDRFADISLAVDEAMSNCADHAYRGQPAGAMAMDMDFDEASGVVKICVTDEGSWQEPDPVPANRFRGRGVMLMNALADECNVDGREDGTTVCLTFRDCAPQSAHRPALASTA